MGLEGLTAIITGAGSGIGKATAAILAGAGVRVALVGRRADRLAAVADWVAASGGEALVEPGDVREYGDLEQIAQRVVERWGRLDILVANAAVIEQSSFSEGDPARWRQVVDTNVMGAFNSIRAALPQMLSAGRGHIVIVASVSGRETYVGEPAYVSSKHALVAIAECLRKEVAKTGTRVTLVEPGVVDTEFVNLDFAATGEPWGGVPSSGGGCDRHSLRARATTRGQRQRDRGAPDWRGALGV